MSVKSNKVVCFFVLQIAYRLFCQTVAGLKDLTRDNNLRIGFFYTKVRCFLIFVHSNDHGGCSFFVENLPEVRLTELGERCLSG